MAVEPSDLVRPRGMFEVLDDAFDLFRERFLLCLCLAGLVGVPAHLIYLPIATAAQSAYQARDSDLTDMFGAAVQFAVVQYAVGLPILAMAGVLQQGALAVVLMDVFDGRQPTLRSVLRALRPHCGALVGAAVMMGLLTLCGICSANLVNLVLQVNGAFVGSVVVFERLGPIAALKRSWRLAMGDLGLCIGVAASLWVLDKFLTLGIGSLVQMVYQAADSERSRQEFVAGQLAQAATSFVLAPVPALATTLLYASLRARREAWDLVRLAGRTDVELAPDPYGVPAP